MIQKGSLWITSIHMIYTKTIPTIAHRNHLIYEGSRTTYNRKLGYHDS
jgi:hypothetical protein